MKKIKKSEVAVMQGAGWFLFCSCVLLFLFFASGCNNKFFDPTQIGRFRPVPAVNVILDTLGVAEETPIAWEQGEEPHAEDTVAMESDYTFRSGDIVRISIFELLQDGVTFVNDYVVTETGKVSIPEVGVIQTAGLTETQLEDEIRRILAPSILKEPSVTAILMASQQRAFSILGDGVSTPGRYVIPRYDFRLTDALATAGGSRQFNVSYIYVSRYTKETAGALKQPRPKELQELELIEPELTEPQLIGPRRPVLPQEEMEVITPRAQRQWPQSRTVITTSEMITHRELAQADDFGILSDGQRDWGEIERKPESTVEPTPERPSRSVQKSSVEPAAPEPTEEAIKNEPVSVEDILKTLSERSGRRGTTTYQAGEVRERGVEEIPATQPTMELPAEEQIGVEETPEYPEVPARERITRQARQRQMGVTPSGRTQVSEGIGVEQVVEPLPGTAGQEKAGEETDIDAVLRSLSERQQLQAGKEVEGVAAPSEEPAGLEGTEERIDVDEVLNTLSERPRREKIGPPPPEEEVGTEETQNLLAEPGTLDVERQIRIEKGVPAPMASREEETGRVEWIFKDGKWVPVQVGRPKPMVPMIEGRGEEMISPPEYRRERPVPGFEGKEVTMPQLIKIPSDKLLAGDPKYNIVIKPGDTIYVPVDVIGEFCIMGNVNNQGYINVTGRPMTLKMAIAAAGGLGPLAWPKTCEVIRRIGREKEEIVLVDLDKIAGGEQPDFFIKPNDLINVGTHPTSLWRAVLRNAFRATYGFGFVYDRNFAYPDTYYGRSFFGM